MRRFFALFLILALAMPGAFAAQAEGRLEGGGYGSPEEAVMAYIDGMNAGDIGVMLQTFALETYVDHLDTDASLQRANFFLSSTVDGIPVTDEYSRSVLLYGRLGGIVSALQYQYVEYSAELNGKARRPMDAAARQELRNEFTRSPLADLRGHVEFVEWLDPAVLSLGRYVTSSNRINQVLYASCLSADDFIDLAAYIRVNGQDAVQFMQCAKFGDRWYNTAPTGILSLVMSLSADRAGLAILGRLSDREEAAYMYGPGTDAVDPALRAVWDGIRGSALCGTRWILESTDRPGVSVCEDREAADGGSGAELWSELRFYGNGGAMVTLVAGAALRERPGLETGTARLGLAWTEADGRPVVEEMQAVPRQHPLDIGIASVRREDDRITFTLSDGTAAVYVRAEDRAEP